MAHFFIVKGDSGWAGTAGLDGFPGLLVSLSNSLCSYAVIFNAH